MIEINPPRDFLAFGLHAGVKAKAVPDFGAVFSTRSCVGTAIFTQNRYPGHPVVLGRPLAELARFQAVVVNSGNSNVATGPAGRQIAEDCVAAAVRSLGVDRECILPCSTGVIGRLPPREVLVGQYGRLRERLSSPDMAGFARAIMTTDTVPKLSARELSGGVRLCGVAKGVGMIEPDMATLLAFVFTDAAILAEDLKRLIRFVANRTFNRVSIDGDTSTSDTFAILANGAAEVRVGFSAELYDALEAAVDVFDPSLLESLPFADSTSREFVSALLAICRDLTRMIARDGEGSSKLIELDILNAANRQQALKVGRELINSPLFKTAVRGADPNWGRIIMAIGNVRSEDIPFDGLRITIGGHPLNMGDNSAEELGNVSAGLAGPEVRIAISLGTGSARETLWGCDLTEDYVRVNAYYTT